MRYLSAGETHGKGILALLDGFPAGLVVDCVQIDAELKRRQGGYGRGGRQQIESDRVEFLTGLWKGRTTGAPLSLWIANKDHKIDEMPEIDAPRPGHADLSGALKYEQPIRPVLERASARETAARVAAGALCKQLLKMFGVTIVGFVRSIGECRWDYDSRLTPDEMVSRRDRSVVYSLCPERDNEAKRLIDRFRKDGDTLGGVIEVHAYGVPVGLGSHAQWDQKLDARLARAVMSVQAIKAVEFGAGFECAVKPGSKVHDPICHDPQKRFYRTQNEAGGIEGGMSNGEPILLRAAMKPIPTLKKPLASVNLHTLAPQDAAFERSDVCAVPAASVVLENAVAIELADAFLQRYGCDSVQSVRK
ncbi:MAG: chorismate synthase [Planctomycetaceae bacterium]|nr:chorismate synthase [Planctomycetaceae bacterium]